MPGCRGTEVLRCCVDSRRCLGSAEVTNGVHVHTSRCKEKKEGCMGDAEQVERGRFPEVERCRGRCRGVDMLNRC